MGSNQTHDGINSSCPAEDRLGMYLDAPEDHPDIATHLETCKECSSKVAAFRSIDLAIGALLDEPAPENLQNNIIAACLKEAEHSEAEAIASSWTVPQRTKPSFFSRPLRYAAALIATAAVSAVATASWILSPVDSKSSENHVAVQEMAPVAFFSLADSRKIANPTSSVNTSNHAMPVSLGKNDARNTTRVVSRLVLPGEVNHVWISDDNGAGVKGLRNLLADRSDLFKLVKVNNDDKDGVTTWQIRCSDENVQRVADTLYQRAGWQLLSPAYPQPGERDAVAFNGKDVTYNLTLIQK